MSHAPACCYDFNGRPIQDLYVTQISSKKSESQETTAGLLNYCQLNPLLGNGLRQSDIWILTERLPSGTDGGTFLANIWETRNLNHIATSSTTGVSLNIFTHEFTISEGQYFIRAMAAANAVGRHKIQLYNVTEGSVEAVGSSAFARSVVDSQSNSDLSTTLSVPTGGLTFELQHRAALTRNQDGFGICSGFGVDEIYSRVVITRL